MPKVTVSLDPQSPCRVILSCGHPLEIKLRDLPRQIVELGQVDVFYSDPCEVCDVLRYANGI